MMLPIIARAADVVLRVVPGGLREAGLALGAVAAGGRSGTSCCRPPGPAWRPR